eukprot:TRINITY_DN8803_c0_g3_i1.p1 TRINITY_DN8803_c0_g3~~TRINITY_DN8803_c0_g3_i1.p1  ORF type:complete len:389 (-),score=121.06 TRINITY_DN8803_c0_g3_i1:59-1225(-)
MSKSDKVYMVKDAYSAFWDNIKFKRGWEKPLFSKEEVDHLLEEAADIVVEIRNGLDQKDPSFKLRMLEGNGREFLWSVQEHPRSNPSNFVRGLIHATFQDANGYVEGLTKEAVEAHINHILQKKEPSSWPCGPSPEKEDMSMAIVLVGDPQGTVETMSEPPREDEVVIPESANQADFSKTHLEILNVTNNIETFRSQILHLAYEADNVNIDQFANDIERGEKVIKNMKQKCLEYNENLMKDLLKLDELVCNQEQKGVRKDQVREIQGLMGDVERIKQKLEGIDYTVGFKVLEKPVYSLPVAEVLEKPVYSFSVAEEEINKERFEKLLAVVEQQRVELDMLKSHVLRYGPREIELQNQIYELQKKEKLLQNQIYTLQEKVENLEKGNKI